MVAVTVSVSDTGVGIPKDVQERIFEPFTQADSSTTRRFGGTGLGLAICRRLIAAMGGSLNIESSPGHGSIFSFTVAWPLAHASDLPASVDTDRIHRSDRQLAILLAEDNRLNRKVAAALLEKMGHHVDAVENGARAVEAVEHGRYDLVLMDCEMPEMDGYDATRAIRALPHHGNLPIVAMTAYAMPEDRQRCLDAGMNDYVSKPISVQRLRRVVERLDVRPAADAA
jgi:CheY-like chemotaxis protein